MKFHMDLDQFKNLLAFKEFVDKGKGTLDHFTRLYFKVEGDVMAVYGTDRYTALRYEFPLNLGVGTEVVEEFSILFEDVVAASKVRRSHCPKGCAVDVELKIDTGGRRAVFGFTNNIGRYEYKGVYELEHMFNIAGCFSLYENDPEQTRPSTLWSLQILKQLGSLQKFVADKDRVELKLRACGESGEGTVMTGRVGDCFQVLAMGMLE